MLFKDMLLRSCTIYHPQHVQAGAAVHPPAFYIAALLGH